MGFKYTAFLCLFFLVVISALPSDNETRSKRDVVEDAKKAASDAADSVAAAVKPTEKSTVDKISDGVKNIGSK